ncbi:MAG: ATP-dependent DNA helicase RecG [Candidatus Omnitrophota bacterium]
MQVKNLSGDTSVRYIKGVGPMKADLFKKVGLERIADLFYYLPRRYEDRSSIKEIKDLKPGETQAVIGEVLKTNVFTARTGTRILEVSIGQGGRRVSAVWYNQPFLAKMFIAGQKVILYGKVELQKHLQISHPVFEILDKGNGRKSLNIGRIVPIYSLTENLTQKYMRKIINEAIDGHLKDARDILPTRVRARRKLVDFRFAVENIHFPYSFENLERAYKRLVFEEFFILQIVMALRRKKIKRRGLRHGIRKDLSRDFEKLFDFTLTGEQKKCIDEIGRDMASEKPMYRLLQGDVGSGKTVVSMYAMLLTVENEYQAAMMVPTDLLARQHYVTVSKAFMPLGLNVRLLVNGVDSPSKEKIKKELKEGDADIVIGTHSLIQEGIEYSNLGLVIIDEQHKFGVEQREKLCKKGRIPDTLIMSATPIPRSLALTVFGDMDISLVKEKPQGRKDVNTYWVGEERREAVYGFIDSEIKKGAQVFIVYPRIKSSAESDLKSAEEMYNHFRKVVFPCHRVALLHGRMKPLEKEKIMKDFSDNKYDMLVSTTVIEVGLDMPNVSIIVVEHAERYGLAQLHQLRGRVGRSGREAFCVFIGTAKTDLANARLQAVAETSDGFELAEKDLEIRGPGEFLGTKQSGLPEIRCGNIAKDFKIMEEAREEAFDLVQGDPKLEDIRHEGVKRNIIERFKGKVRV